jgi:Lrp/AsnC family transcriptional regulator, leucine-responsive regulatory protein
MTVEINPVTVTNRQPRLDAVDHALIQQLLRNARMTNEELSRRVSISRPAVVGRLKRLHEIRAIRGYTVIPDWELLGYPILTFVQVRTGGRCREASLEIACMHLDGVVVEECHRTTGEWCLLVKIRARSSTSVETFLDEVTKSDNVKATMTMMAFSA